MEERLLAAIEEWDVAHELWRMAVGYQQRAAYLDGGKLPHIGEKPAHLRRIAAQRLIKVNAKVC